MKKAIKIISICAVFLLALSFATYSQNITRDAQGNFHAVKKGAADSTTTYTFEDKDGKVYKVYHGPRGGLFVWKPNKEGVMTKKRLPNPNKTK